MATIIRDLRDTFRRGNISMRLIYINAGVFVATALIDVLFRLFNTTIGGLYEWLELPASFLQFAMQPWSILTYMFMHAGLLHILFNMLWLYWFGALFLMVFSARHLRGVYILGGICGGLLYMIAYNLFPLFSPMVERSYLLGASASVLAIVAATAYREPNYPVRLFLMGTIRLKYLALVVIGLDLLFITTDNGGGHIAHVGGALAGLWFAASLSKGKDATAWINRTLDFVENLFRFQPRKPKMKIRKGGAYSDRQSDYDYNARKRSRAEEIDRILDKVKKSGYDNLTTEEKKSLFDASKR
jgi:membrane associated rhomboid family serine protease